MVKACFDYGHGGKDPGAIGNGMYEKDVVFSIGRKCKEIVERHGVQVVETRSGDIYLSLTERANISNKNNCNILVSFHTNAFTNPNARGFEIWTSKGQTKGDVLATRIGEQIKKDFPNVPFRANYSDGDLDKEENFTVIAKAKAPACLIEMGFITNKEDAQIIKTQQDKIAESIAKGILSYFGIKYQEPKKEESKQQKESGKLYKVQVGAFSKRENAEKLLEKLKKAGFDGFIKYE